MARIETYTAQRGLDPGSTPGVQVSNALANATQGLGGAVQDAAATYIQRIEQKENFKTENDYRRLKLQLDGEMQTRADSMEPGGDGFTDTFVSEVYKPKRDEFLATVPDRLKERFTTLLADETGADTAAYQIAAATVERNEGYRWQKGEINLTHEQLATGIAMNPEAYQEYLDSGLAIINSSSLPTPEKALLTANWKRMAMVSHINQMMADDPQGVLRELGVDARQLSPTTQFSIISQAVQWQESRNNPDAISGKGAIGLMQIMPATAGDVAKMLGDERFPHGAPENVIRQYLSNPEINKMYGERYLRQQLRDFSNTVNPIETALVAYNAGPGVARRWVESGYDDSMLPKETRDYKEAILASITSPVAQGRPEDVQFVANGQDVHLDTVNPDLRNRVADAFATIGITQVKVNDGTRSEAENTAAGGATNSQHLDANAMDIDVSGYSHAKRIEIIKSLSAAGVMGLGIGANMIHADMGGRRAWGYATSAGGGAVPAWAAGVITQHLEGNVAPPRSVNTRYAALNYDDRQRFITQADQAIAAQQTALSRVSAVDKTAVRLDMTNELALIRTTGQSSGQFDETRIASLLGEDDYLSYVYKKEQAQRTFTAIEGVSQMSLADMEGRLADYKPSPGGGDFDRQQEIEAAVEKEITRVTNLRARHPDEAALEFPEVAAAWDAAIGPDRTPEAMRAFIEKTLAVQGEFGVAPAARAPVPRSVAMEVGLYLSRPPANTDTDIPQAERDRQALVARYASVVERFGDYADEVIIYALSEYKGMSPEMAAIIGANMLAIQAGREPPMSRARLYRQEDIDAMRAAGGGNWTDFFTNLFGPGTAPPPAARQTGAPSNAARIRALEEEGL